MEVYGWIDVRYYDALRQVYMKPYINIAMSSIRHLTSVACEETISSVKLKDVRAVRSGNTW